MQRKSTLMSFPISVDLQEAACKFQDSQEFIKLFSFSENNVAHANENVGDHSLSVTNELVKMTSLSFISDERTRKYGETYLNAVVETHSRRDLLVFSGLFHDLGKGEKGIIRFDARGISTATNHERHSARLASAIIPRFIASETECRYLERILRLHGGFPLSFFTYLATQIDEDIWKILEPNECIVETLLYMFADNGGIISFKETKDYIEGKLLPLIFGKISRN